MAHILLLKRDQIKMISPFIMNLWLDIILTKAIPNLQQYPEILKQMNMKIAEINYLL